MRASAPTLAYPCFLVVALVLLCSSHDCWAQWTRTTAQLSEARWLLSATTVGDKVLFAGGTKFGSAQESSPENYSNVVDIYHDLDQSWSTATLSQGRTELAATTVGTKALFGGGLIVQSSSAVVDIFDNNTGGWSTATLSLARHDLAAASVGSKAFFAGGRVYAGFPSKVVDIYNASTNAWTTDSLSVARTELAGVSLGTKVFFAGGWSYSGEQQYSNVVDIFDTSTGLWTTATLSQARIRVSAASLGSKVFFAGGVSINDYSNVVDIYDNQTGLWTTKTLSETKDALAVTAAGNKVFFAGGYHDGVNSSEVDIYDMDSNTWTTADLQSVKNSLAASSVGTKAIFAGGSEPPASLSVDIFDVVITGLGELSPGFELMIYPNPADQFLEIKWPDYSPGTGIEVSVTDLIGRPSISKEMSTDDHSLYVGTLAPGCYMIRASQGQMRRIQKFIKK